MRGGGGGGGGSITLFLGAGLVHFCYPIYILRRSFVFHLLLFFTVNVF